jgi:hypothetical protein
VQHAIRSQTTNAARNTQSDYYCRRQYTVWLLLRYAICSQATTAACNTQSDYYCSTQYAIK